MHRLDQLDTPDAENRLRYQDNSLAFSVRDGRQTDHGSRRSSNDMGMAMSVSDYDLDYAEELELNNAFNIFKEI
jgi:hypothetical protein